MDRILTWESGGSLDSLKLYSVAVYFIFSVINDGPKQKCLTTQSIDEFPVYAKTCQDHEPTRLTHNKKADDDRVPVETVA